ncbi:MAG TPA: hypothetical protein VKE98_06855 [Gemmataceae bacterium]|nr:hypothetical protein [Gemmataceae bacterium]
MDHARLENPHNVAAGGGVAGVPGVVHGSGAGAVSAAATITQPKTFNPPTIKPPNFNPPRNLNPPGINQPNIPFNPPVLNPPNNLQTWVCSRCGANLGNGAAPVGQCPSCKARIINGAGGGNPGFNAPNFPNPPPADFVRLNQAPPPAAVTNSSGSGTVGYIMGAIAGLGMMIGGVITSLKCGGIF